MQGARRGAARSPRAAAATAASAVKDVARIHRPRPPGPRAPRADPGREPRCARGAKTTSPASSRAATTGTEAAERTADWTGRSLDARARKPPRASALRIGLTRSDESREVAGRGGQQRVGDAGRRLAVARQRRLEAQEADQPLDEPGLGDVAQQQRAIAEVGLDGNQGGVAPAREQGGEPGTAQGVGSDGEPDFVPGQTRRAGGIRQDLHVVEALALATAAPAKAVEREALLAPGRVGRLDEEAHPGPAAPQVEPVDLADGAGPDDQHLAFALVHAGIMRSPSTPALQSPFREWRRSLEESR